MLDDMPQRQGSALVAHSEDAVAEMVDPPARPRLTKLVRRSRTPREKVVKQSALGMMLRPIGMSLALILSAYALMSLGITFWRSYQSHLDHTAAVHADKSCSTSSSAI